jgi:hypothetical protein
MTPIWCNLPWWTETNAAWAQAFGLFITFFLQVGLLYLTLREQKEARHERRHAEVARQRSEVTCAAVTSALGSLTDEELTRHLWAGHFRHGGFAFDVGLHFQLPEYLLRKCEPYSDQIEHAMRPNQHLPVPTRFLLVFRFPFPEYNAVLEDVEQLHFGNAILVWDESGKAIKIRRD